MEKNKRKTRNATRDEKSPPAAPVHPIGAPCPRGPTRRSKRALRRNNDRGAAGGLDVHGMKQNNPNPVKGWRLVGLAEAQTGDLIILGKFQNGKQHLTGHKISVIAHESEVVDGITYINGVRFGEQGEVLHHFEFGSSWYFGKQTGPGTRHMWFNETTGKWLDPMNPDLTLYKGGVAPVSDKLYRNYDIGGVYRNRAYEPKK